MDCIGRRTVFLSLRQVAVFCATMALGGQAQAFSADVKLSGSLNSKDALAVSRPIDVIVEFKTNPSQKEIAKLQRLGFHLTRHLPIINGVSGSIRADQLRRVAVLPQVINVSDDMKVGKTDAFTTNSSVVGPAHSYGILGSGVTVAVLDSGIGYVEDLAANSSSASGTRVLGSVDFTGYGTKDQCGHGTHVAGIVAGDGFDSSNGGDTQTFTGIAPAANVVNVRVLDSTGTGSVSNVIAGVQWVQKNAKAYGIRVLNVSLGHPVCQSYTKDPLCKAVEAAWKAGIVVVCAAGNDGRANATPLAGAPNGGYGIAYGTIECPGNDPYVITVGATKSIDGNRADDQIATYSSRGPTVGDLVVKPDIIAPGNRVISTEDPGNSYLVKTFGSDVEIPLSTYQGGGNGYSPHYFCLSGTSMATPVVSGAAALMIELQPQLTPDTVKARLMAGADKWVNPDGTPDVFTYGAGYLNIVGALLSRATTNIYAMSPTVAIKSSTYTVQLTKSVWDNRAMWGTGGNLQTFYGNRAMWGTNFTNVVETSTLQSVASSSFQSYAASASSTTGVDCTAQSIVVNGD